MDVNEEIEKIPYKNNFLIIEPFGVYSFFRVRMELGETPKYLKDQMFTTRTAAKTEINKYISANTKPKLEKGTE
jgi:hypothetical protein